MQLLLEPGPTPDTIAELNTARAAFMAQRMRLNDAAARYNVAAAALEALGENTPNNVQVMDTYEAAYRGYVIALLEIGAVDPAAINNLNPATLNAQTLTAINYVDDHLWEAAFSVHICKNPADIPADLRNWITRAVRFENVDWDAVTAYVIGQLQK